MAPITFHSGLTHKGAAHSPTLTKPSITIFVIILYKRAFPRHYLFIYCNYHISQLSNIDDIIIIENIL